MDTNKLVFCISRCIELQYALLHADSLVRSEVEIIIHKISKHLIENIDSISYANLQYAKDCCEKLNKLEIPLHVEDMLSISQVIANLKTRLDINL